MKRNILLLEECDALRQSIVFMLNEEGFTAIPVASVQEADQKAAEGHIDLLITDVESSISRGFERLKLLTKGSTRFPFPAIIVHSDVFGAYEISQNVCRKTRFITKPFSRDVLIAAVTDLLQKGSAPSTV